MVELLHYTTVGGLMGIIESNYLHASHYRFLNDPNELQFGKNEIIGLLYNELESCDENDISLNEYESYMEINSITPGTENIKLTIANYAADQIFFKQNLQSTAYIISFSLHDSNFEIENGRLSQWRGYGQEGGYALCFNQPQLLEMFSNEPNGGQYKTLYTKSVSYGAVHWPNDLKDEARRYVLNLVKQKFDSQYENIQKYLTERFMAVLISTKSRAFHEECERRIVAVTDNTIADGALKKEVKFKPRGGGIIPYIELFKNVGKLPIERIVVGPHPNQERRAELLRVYLAAKGYANVRVTSSAIQILLFP
jgi:hypothetical protein